MESQRTLTMLVVEDDPQLLKLYEAWIAHLGHQVTCVNSGAAALEELEDHAAGYDVVMTDLAMPGMDGYALREKLQERFPQLPVIVVTAWLQREEQKLRSVFDGALGKPFDLYELQAVIEAVVG